MANMEFNYVNICNTITCFSVTSGTTTVSYLIDRIDNLQYQSSGFNNDNTTSSIVVSFSATTYVDRIVLQNINWKSFKIFYNNTSTNLIPLSNCPTASSSWATNSMTTMYLRFSSLTALSRLDFQVTATMNPNEEKKCGEIWVLRNYYVLPENPDEKKFKPKFVRKEYVHDMSDGGKVTYVISDRYAVDIGLTAQSRTVTDNLYNLYTLYTPFVFIPFPTSTTEWDENIYQVNWIGDFTFLEFFDNYMNNGYDGTIKLVETSK